MNSSTPQVPVLSFNVPNVVTGGRIVLAGLIIWLLTQGSRAEILLAGILLSIA